MLRCFRPFSCLVLSVLLPAALLAAGPPPTPALARALPAVQKAVQLRLLDGTPVTGVVVQLTATNAPSHHATTDTTGGVVFADLGLGLWTVTFTGTVQGRPIQPAAAQGLPPYGTNNNGGGFLVQVEVQAEDAAPTPVLHAGVAQPEIQMSRFVLLSTPAGWAVTWDLAGLTGAPLPYTALTLGNPTPLPAVGTAGSPAAPRPAPAPPPRPPYNEWLLVGGALLLSGLLYLGYLLRQERQARRAGARRDA